MNTEQLLTITELAEALKCTRQTIYAMSDLPHITVGNGVKRRNKRYLLSDVIDHLKRKGNGNGG